MTNYHIRRNCGEKRVSMFSVVVLCPNVSFAQNHRFLLLASGKLNTRALSAHLQITIYVLNRPCLE